MGYRFLIIGAGMAGASAAAGLTEAALSPARFL
jgi:glycine/D-amino acid oxidase-like deaminating enzyme